MARILRISFLTIKDDSSSVLWSLLLDADDQRNLRWWFESNVAGKCKWLCVPKRWPPFWVKRMFAVTDDVTQVYHHHHVNKLVMVMIAVMIELKRTVRTFEMPRDCLMVEWILVDFEWPNQIKLPAHSLIMHMYLRPIFMRVCELGII